MQEFSREMDLFAREIFLPSRHGHAVLMRDFFIRVASNCGCGRCMGICGLELA